MYKWHVHYYWMFTHVCCVWIFPLNASFCIDGLTVTVENLIKAAVIHMHSCITEREGYLNIITILHVAPKQAWNIPKSMFVVLEHLSINTCCLENCKYLAHNYFPISIGGICAIWPGTVLKCSHYTLELCRAKELCWCWSVVDNVSTRSHYFWLCNHTSTLLLWLISSRHATHTCPVLQSRVAMVGRQLLLFFAEACEWEYLRHRQTAVRCRRCLFCWPACHCCCTRCGVYIPHRTCP